MEKLEWIWRYPIVSIWTIVMLAIILLVLLTRIAQLLNTSPPLSSGRWSKSDIIRRPRLGCFVYLLIALACSGTAWDLRLAYREPTVLLALIALVSAAAYMLLKAWTDCRGALLIIDERGIASSKYGMIPWIEVEKVKLSVGPFGNGGEFSNLFLYVSNAEKYRKKLPPFQSLYERFLAKKVTELKDPIVISLDGFYRKPSYIFAMVEHLHQQALRQFGKESAGATTQKTDETKHIRRWKQVIYTLTDVVGTGALLVTAWWLARH